MVARGERDDTTGALAGRQAQQLVEGAADLEGTRPLEILTLEEYGIAGRLVEGPAGDHRRAVNAALQAAGRGLDLLERQHGHPDLTPPAFPPRSGCGTPP